MSDWFLISVWYERDETELHYEVANEDGEQFFFFVDIVLVNEDLNANGSDALSGFYYAEEDMLSLAVTIIDEEMVEPEQNINMTRQLFERHF